MINGSSRRQVLRTAGVACGGGLVGGCVTGGDEGPTAGDLLIRNTDSEPHTVEITVQKTSDDDDATHQGPEIQTPAATPLEERGEDYLAVSISEGDRLRLSAQVAGA
ncbi:hypothetical protein I7X12_10805 [Halosimplex litoreum]|uniref:Twin-arginine translocation signal domain-containing protein n=1 Tax=Halosimplex litoreum TaxID=1198301 RepID=A0A7T3KTK1_9EURY|nr:hypothetical protein [Halosimplex litoreum]QPV61259.1 hypothetical protein I7X12_10805 [Halosimplex litoreum]